MNKQQKNEQSDSTVQIHLDRRLSIHSLAHFVRIGTITHVKGDNQKMVLVKGFLLVSISL